MRRIPSWIMLAAYALQLFVTGPLHILEETERHDDCPACCAQAPSGPSLEADCDGDRGAPCHDPSHRHHNHPVHDDECLVCRTLHAPVLPAAPVPCAIEAAAAPGRDTAPPSFAPCAGWDPSAPPRAPPVSFQAV